MIKLPKQIEFCLEELNKKYEAVLVGGAVRNSLLNKKIEDYDITTSATPDEVKEVFVNHAKFDTGIKHGTITVVIDVTPVEITTYRVDLDYADGRHPTEVKFTTNLMEDCARRDFTINALCYKPDGEILDFFNGKEDLENKIIRCILDPNERFSEDALRIMRAIRFSAQLNFTIEENTKQAIFRNKDNLKMISIERFTDEFLKIINTDVFPELFVEYLDVFAVRIPKLKELAEQIFWCETISKLEHSETNVAYRLAIIFMNLSTLTNSTNDLLTSASNFVLLGSELRFSNELSSTVAKYIQNSEVEIATDRMSIKKLLHKFQDTFFDYLGFRKSYNISEETYNIVIKEVQDIIASGECYSLKQLAINGNDLVDLGISGSKISMILNNVLNQVIEEKLENNRYMILDYVKTEFK